MRSMKTHVRTLMTCVVALSCALTPRVLRAQRAGMPDLSTAPADIQAIYKKVMSGGRPTPEEARKLGQYMAAHAGDIQKQAESRAAAARAGARASANAKLAAIGRAGDNGPACPSSSSNRRAPVVTAASAAAMLDTLERTYLARETPQGGAQLRTNIAKTNDPAALDESGSILFVAGYHGAAIEYYVAAIRHEPTADPFTWTNLGTALDAAGDPTHALVALGRAQSLGGKSALLLEELGVAHADLGDLATATTLLDEATRAGPKLAVAWDALARVQSCRGDMVAAWRSVATAQALDWNPTREAEITHHEPESNDPKVEAEKPLPLPATPPTFPPPPPPPSSSVQTPTFAPDWKSERGHTAVFIQAENEYAQIAKDALKPDANASQASENSELSTTATGGTLLVMDISNTKAVNAAVDRVEKRAGAKFAMMQTAYHDKFRMIHEEGRQKGLEITEKYRTCQAQTRADLRPAVCDPPYCSAMVGAFSHLYQEQTDAARVLIGGVSGLMTQVNTAMIAWFNWASDPRTRARVDSRRRYTLAWLTSMMNAEAAMVDDASAESSLCFGPYNPAAVAAAKAKADSAADAGACEKFNKSIPFIVSIKGNCHELRVEISVPLPATPALEYHRAEGNRDGSLFVGAGKGVAAGLAKGEVGLQVNFNEGGWVQGFGPAAHASAGNEHVAVVSAGGMVNILDHGSAGEASAGFNGLGAQLAISTTTGFVGSLK